MNKIQEDSQGGTHSFGGKLTPKIFSTNRIHRKVYKGELTKTLNSDFDLDKSKCMIMVDYWSLSKKKSPSVIYHVFMKSAVIIVHEGTLFAILCSMLFLRLKNLVLHD